MQSFLSSCSYVAVSNSNVQKVTIEVIDVDNKQILKDVRCAVTNSDGRIYYTHKNPDTVIIPENYGTLSVHCTSAGYVNVSMMVGNSFNPETNFAVLLWPGFTIAEDSELYKKHPSHYLVGMRSVVFRDLSKIGY